jgi:hypothetical protein
MVFGSVLELPIRHFLGHVEKEFAIDLFRLSQRVTKLVQITSLFSRASPSRVVGRLTLQDECDPKSGQECLNSSGFFEKTLDAIH